MKLDDAPWKNDYGPEPDMRPSRARSYSEEPVEHDTESAPPAIERHERMLKALAQLDSAVTKLDGRLETVLRPERPSPSNGDVGGAKSDDSDLSILQQRHDMYLTVLQRIAAKVYDIAERVDL